MIYKATLMCKKTVLYGYLVRLSSLLKMYYATWPCCKCFTGLLWYFWIDKSHLSPREFLISHLLLIRFSFLPKPFRLIRWNSNNIFPRTTVLHDLMLFSKYDNSYHYIGLYESDLHPQQEHYYCSAPGLLSTVYILQFIIAFEVIDPEPKFSTKQFIHHKTTE